jgi:threonine/homoserine/homoserine lactone efflux protein
MNEISSLAAIFGVLCVGTVSPGPSFVMVARTAVSSGQAEATAASLGMGIGGVIFAIVALAGLQALLLAVPTLYVVLKLAGGLYLAYLGIRILRGSGEPLTVSSEPATKREGSLLRFLIFGLGTQLSNPKTAIVYASVFATFLPRGVRFQSGVALVVMVFLLETSWYALVALVLSAEKPRKAYLRFKSLIDRVAGGMIFLLGMKLASSARVI